MAVCSKQHFGCDNKSVSFRKFASSVSCIEKSQVVPLKEDHSHCVHPQYFSGTQRKRGTVVDLA